ncbi:2-amino-4-hydroxy-6-hydroxymethyldihydropteridine diphosphokinase [Variovorax sp. J22G73]|jgi:2-amino-4-hydroxy-6-hydroxymethyldihydropteridine diphosphokinase|uniref:2-amino-4-hydroxy-6- hydroxymethyldihydropteridine diphosphokinase n=1 Tax=unclassified Variovorax TaxID=663243 RepID=UPI000D5D5C9D|nr:MULTISPECIES: 2-amino-4-hydroxy-6-hydroxymethyldihydropteridine diphosphokinase [unclassified Variovorax]MDM0004077.1 2-amino-4-hydroxy-6-hydroxymethyldihydropteridine diphosphokinase [Variovorax sp. J22R203]MDM0096257.1 2-amino-4-hydroxy-6-hydroxymethyldihydropteridine diphosphokinase [Variovorax sp. J22G73]
MSAFDRPKDGKKDAKNPPAKAAAKKVATGVTKAPAKDAVKPAARPRTAPPRAGGKPPPAGARSGPPARRAPRGLREDYPTVQAFVAIGANLGDAEASVKAAMAAIGALQRTQVTARSSLYRSDPVDAEGPDFVNAVVAVRTGLDAEQFLVALQRLETQAGRERPFPNAPRTLDLDLLMHGNSVMDTPTLTLPHPRMRERAFVLKPLAEIAPDKVPRAALARVTGQVVKRIT